MRCKLYRYEKSNFVSSYKLTNQLEVHISGGKKEKHKATNQSKFVIELKSHAIREAPWMIHCRLHVVTKLMHQQLEPKDPRIPARCSIMGPWLEILHHESRLWPSESKSRSRSRGSGHPNRNPLELRFCHKIQLLTIEIYLAAAQINPIAAKCEVPQRISYPHLNRALWFVRQWADERFFIQGGIEHTNGLTAPFSWQREMWMKN